MQIVKAVGVLVISAMLAIGCKERRETTTPKKSPESPLQQVDEILTGGGAEKPTQDPPLPTQGENGETEAPKIPVAAPVPDKPGFVISPYNGKWIDVTGVKPGTLMEDPHFAEEKKYFRVPEIPVQPENVPTEETPEGKPAEVEETEV